MATILGLDLSHLFYLCLVPLLILLFIKLFSETNPKNNSRAFANSFWDFLPHLEQHIQYTSNAVLKSPNSTFYFYFSPFHYHIVTANPANVKHILKDRFDIYEKDSMFKLYNTELLGDGIFNTDGEKWKFQRQVASHEFSTKSLRKFVEHVVDVELSDRLIPILSKAAENNSVIDFQDILQRFTLDTICKIAFGYDPLYLLPSLPKEKFATAYDDAVEFSVARFFQLYPIIWKTKRFLNIGSEKKLKEAVKSVREFTREVIKEKKRELEERSVLDSMDILSRFLSSGVKDEKLAEDVIINFVLAGRDTTSAALTWFFWLLSKNRRVESEILREIKGKSDVPIYDEVKDMTYTHASLTECMRLYPPVPVDPKTAKEDNILPSGIRVRKGETVAYHPYAMGRSEKLWGRDWSEFRPERWLKIDDVDGSSWKFVAKNSFVYPVFQAGPRICLGKDMAYLQMKRVVAEVLRQFKVVPVLAVGVEPVLISHLTIKMRDGFPVRIKKRD